jgi:hypothetical protein
MGPIEIALRNAPNRKTQFIFEPLLGLTFDSDKEAYDFYNMYSWEVGFGIKYENSPSNNKRGYHTGRDLRCLCHVSVSLLVVSIFIYIHEKLFGI